MHPPALVSCLVLLIAWGYFFWPSWSVYVYPKASWDIFLFNVTIVLISAYVVLLKQSELRKVAFTSSQAAIFCFFIIATTWVVADPVGVPDLQQPLSLIMVPAIILATFGPYVARVLIFPLFYFLLIIPFYESDLPGRIFIMWIAFSLAFAYFRYTTLANRLLFVFLGTMIPIAIRWLNFESTLPSIIGFMALLCFGYFFAEPKRFYATKEMGIQPGKELITKKARWFIPTIVLFFIIASAPWLSSNIRAFYPGLHKPITLIAPQGTGDWEGPESALVAWEPKFIQPSAIISVEYSNKPLRSIVYLYSAYYQSDRNVKDLIRSQNSLYDATLWTSIQSEPHSVSLRHTKLTVMETRLEREGTTQLIWSWFFVLGIPTVDLGFIEILDKIRQISKYSDGSGIIAVSTDVTVDIDQARKYLETFLKEMYPSLEILERPERISS